MSKYVACICGNKRHSDACIKNKLKSNGVKQKTKLSLLACGILPKSGCVAYFVEDFLKIPQFWNATDWFSIPR